MAPASSNQRPRRRSEGFDQIAREWPKCAWCTRDTLNQPEPPLGRKLTPEAGFRPKALQGGGGPCGMLVVVGVTGARE